MPQLGSLPKRRVAGKAFFILYPILAELARPSVLHYASLLHSPSLQLVTCLCQIPDSWPLSPMAMSFPFTQISLGDIWSMPRRSRFTIFRVFLNFWSKAPKFRSVGGEGVCVCFLKSVRKGRFRNIWVRWGGGGGDWHPPCVQRHGPQAVSCAVFRCFISRTLHHAMTSLYPDLLSGVR